ncbi:lysosomal alpha-mannosidase-like [Physella acuta]|uniref:lysosomal alpha-mannosidase-like n=1 Tax=Physella acuta TaxID=109671 RepID=UPI0027DE8872|nr:lysosomal alpha-mannosidase-like [Physella acuta]
MLWLRSSVVLLVLWCTCTRVDCVQTCGYQSCNAEKPGMINVHIVPHSHDDVGWLVTVDQYYYQSVQFILDSVLAELTLDPTKRFIVVEVAYFYRWVNELSLEQHQQVFDLVNEGRLEFISGGWSMNDEAATHYLAIIDQHKLGFEFLRDSFGSCARVKAGWQIDPFGHSRELASLFAQFGFDALIFSRLDQQDNELRQVEKRLEFVWKGSPKNIGPSSNLFTSILPYGYSPQDPMHFDVQQIYQPMNTELFADDPALNDYNVDSIVDAAINAINIQATVFATNHLLVPAGGDFNYVSAHFNFKEMDKLIKYVNARQANGSNINFLYSTPSCYVKAVNDDNATWTTKEDDFFPYADSDHSYWTGYFTSRPTVKRYIRVVNGFYQSVKKLATNLLQIGIGRDLLPLADALGAAQHHDAITGTEKQVVAFDYALRLSDGVRNGLDMVNTVYRKLMYKGTFTPPTQEFCPLLNESICDLTRETYMLQATLYNPLARLVEYMVRLPVAGSGYTVIAPDGTTEVEHQLVPGSAQTQTLVFPATLPPLGYATYFVNRQTDVPKKPAEVLDQEKPKAKSSKRSHSSTTNVIQGKYVSVTFDEAGHLAYLTNLESGVTTQLSQNFYFYPGFGQKGQSSGAYIFRPANNTPTSIPLTLWQGTRNGTLVQEAYQQFTDLVSQVVRVYREKRYVEFQWTVGPIPVSDGIGKEVITRFNIPGWGNKGVFYTDANGRELLERKINYRPTWNVTIPEPVAGNYYPITTMISIKNDKNQFTVLTDRSHGGTSLNDGDVELMLHRRLLHDDSRGVNEALNETGSDGRGLVVQGSLYVVLDTIDRSARQYRSLAQELILSPLLTFSTLDVAPADYVKNLNTTVSGLMTQLPPNVHLLSLEPFLEWGPVASPSNTIPLLIRFEHFYEVGEDEDLSKPVTFDIQNIFRAYPINDVYELNLGANIPIEEVKRLHWRTNDASGSDVTSPIRHLNGTVVTLNPMEIVTLQANIQL